MALGAESEPWLPRYIDVLKKSRPPYARPGTVALIDGEGGARYLVLDWSGPKWDSYHGTFLPLEIHKVIHTKSDGLRLKWLRSFAYEGTSLDPPTGQAVFKGEAPIAVIFVSTGGSHVSSAGLRLIQMKRNSVDITPDWAGRTVDVVDLDGDGAFEVVAIDERWRGYFFGGLFGPYLPVVLSRRDGQFNHACRRFAELYLSWLEGTKDWSRQSTLGRHLYQMVYWSAAYLVHIQIGGFAEARRDLDNLNALVAEQPPDGMTAEEVMGDFTPVLSEALANPDDPCPASTTRTGRRRGGTVSSFSRRFGLGDD